MGYQCCVDPVGRCFQASITVFATHRRAIDVHSEAGNDLRWFPHLTLLGERLGRSGIFSTNLAQNALKSPTVTMKQDDRLF